jgi:acetyltransferase-like isoleucine patch superfamily enzyme
VGDTGKAQDEVYVHPTAIVEPGAQIGAHAHVRSGARIGADCNIGKNAYVDAGAVVGDRVKIQNNVSVYVGVEIGDDVFVGPGAVFTNDLTPRAFSAHWQVVPTRIGSGASIGANATIVCGREIGELAMVAAGSVVTRNVAGHQLVLGNPARPGGWVCTCGAVVSRGDEPAPDAVCPACGQPWRRAVGA